MRIFACFFFACFFQFAGAQNLSVLEFLGYKAGEQFTSHHRVIDYFRYVANNSEKVQFIPYGKSWEGRDLALVVVSSPDNIRNIQTVRRNNLIKTGFLEGNITGRELPIVWLSYNVHGDESASTEAALMTLEALAANSHDTDKWLEEVVVIMDPCLNPDGRDRYVNFYLETGNNPPNPHKDAREHYPPWPGGRVNHYLFATPSPG